MPSACLHFTRIQVQDASIVRVILEAHADPNALDRRPNAKANANAVGYANATALRKLTLKMTGLPPALLRNRH